MITNIISVSHQRFSSLFILIERPCFKAKLFSNNITRVRRIHLNRVIHSFRWSAIVSANLHEDKISPEKTISYLPQKFRITRLRSCKPIRQSTLFITRAADPGRLLIGRGHPQKPQCHKSLCECPPLHGPCCLRSHFMVHTLNGRHLLRVIYRRAIRSFFVILLPQGARSQRAITPVLRQSL